jgi:hypothetical protein
MGSGQPIAVFETMPEIAIRFAVFWRDNHAGGSLAKAPRTLIDVEKR